MPRPFPPKTCCSRGLAGLSRLTCRRRSGGGASVMTLTRLDHFGSGSTMTSRIRPIRCRAPVVTAAGRGLFSTTSAAATADNPPPDPICELASSALRYGPSSTSELGHDLAQLNARRILLFVDPNVRKLEPYANVMASIERHAPRGHEVDVYDGIRVEPNDVSFRHAIEYATGRVAEGGPYDAVVALGGGSTIDTAKAANLYSCHPPEGGFYDYVNPPLGRGLPVPPGRLAPLVAIPTTAGTGSETTGVAIFDDVPTRSKTGIAHRSLRPTLGIVDPDNMRTLPPSVARYSGIDVLCHALESYTAIPYRLRPGGRPASPTLRPAYQGSNPISDVWSLHALRECASYLPRMAADPCGDDEARGKMCLAASSAGMGFGNAGVHLCHGMSYAIASQVGGGYRTEGYPRMGGASDDGHHGLVAHGLSVAISSPSVFRFTGEPGRISGAAGERSRDRHAECAAMLADARLRRSMDAGGGAHPSVPSERAIRDQPGEALANELLELMHSLEIPVGIRSLGYDESDVDDLARGTLPQHRVTKLSPRQPVELEELRGLFRDALDG